MKVDQLVGERFRERPSDCVIDSHALTIRGGYAKYVANGIFSLFTPMRRVTRKIEAIIREEMDKIDGQEVLFPVALPGSLWEESGRFQSVGAELLRFTDRNGQPMVLGMTHEEAAVQLVREYGQSHLKYPFMIYQIQTKFRDEARPRGGLIRVREFTMKDAYSFHTSQEDLEAYYARCYDAYLNIFRRAGLRNVMVVASDSGMMGGSLSHEYMLITPVGEDSIAICKECDFRANMEAAESLVTTPRDAASADLAKIATPGRETIEDVCAYLNAEAAKSVKAVVYQMNATDECVVVFLRGDLEANETKITNFLGGDIHPAAIQPGSDIVAGFIGPVGLKGAKALFDASLRGANNMIAGANEAGFHVTGLDFDRDLPGAAFHDFAKITEGGICPHCKKPAITIARGIEVGNIFQLGTKYTTSMGMKYLDADGALKNPIMGCYGIGVGRLAASVLEESHDDFGPIWPISIAPWQVQVCCVRADDAAAHAFADALYADLQSRGIDVIYDDRAVSAGVMFSDADLIAAPVRAVVSPRNMKEGVVEIVTRDKSVSKKAPAEGAADEIAQMVKDMLASLT